MNTIKPWLSSYEPHVPETIDYPANILPEILTETARKYPQRVAMIYKGTKVTFREFDQAVYRFGAVLQRLGIQKGDRVAIHLPNCPQFPISYYATLRVGGIVVPCNPVYRTHEMTHQLQDSGAKVIVTLSSQYPMIKQIRPNTALEHVVVANIKDYFPAMLRLLFTLMLEKKKGHRVSIEGDDHTYWFKDLMKEDKGSFQSVPVYPEDTAVFMYTGGTTGLSKGAMLTHKNILVNAYQCKAWINSSEAMDVTLTQIPLFHCYGMTTCMNLATISANTMVLIPDPRDYKDVIKTISKTHPTLYPGVPALYNAINNYPNIEKYDIKSIRVCISGAAGLPVEVQQRFQNLTGSRLVEGYGLSEASPVVIANPINGENRIGTIGIPWPDTEVQIVDVDSGAQVLQTGEVGELCVRGPQVMKGYWNMPEETANSLYPALDGGSPWLHTGDIAVMDAGGFFKIVDRKKDMILGAGGFNIYPREIEDTLYQHPKVLEAGAVGIPAGEKGERIKVFIVLKPGEQATEEEIIEFCRQNLAPYKVPRYVEFRDQLPKSTVGKLLRRELLSEELKTAQKTAVKDG